MRTKLYRELTAALLVAGMLLQSATAAAPGWWSAQGVIIPGRAADDYAALNQGQLKSLAAKAWLQMELALPGGAGAALNQLISGWRLRQPQTDDYAAVNAGQLKAVVRPFYERLSSAGLAAVPQWLAQPAVSADDFAVVNLGQAKALFSFAIPQALGAAPQRLSGNGMNGLAQVWNSGIGRPPLLPQEPQRAALPSVASEVEVSYYPTGSVDWGVLKVSHPLTEGRIAVGHVWKTADVRYDNQGALIREGWIWGGDVSGGGPGVEGLAANVASLGQLRDSLDGMSTLADEPDKNFSHGIYYDGYWGLRSRYDKIVSTIDQFEWGESWVESQVQLRVSAGGLTDSNGDAWWQVNRIIRDESWQIIRDSVEFLPAVMAPTPAESSIVTINSRHSETSGEEETVSIKLITPSYLQVNDGDADGDGIPDYEDGQEVGYPDPGDEPDLPQTAPLTGLPHGFGGLGTRVRFRLEGQGLRLWRQALFKSHQLNRDPRMVSEGGDQVPWDQWLDAVDLGLTLVESLAPSEVMHDQVVTIEVDRDGDGPVPPSVYHRSYFTSIGAVLEKVENGQIGERDRRMRPSLQGLRMK